LAKLLSALELVDFDPAFGPQIIEPQGLAGKFLANKDLDLVISFARGSFRLAIIGRQRCGRQGQMSQQGKENFAGAVAC
jgi:hypothetical protein